MSVEALTNGLLTLGLALSPQQQELLLRYVKLLAKWNRVYNLTAIPEAQMISHHLLDSLAVLPHLKGTSVADVGSGAGLPGIPLAIARPAWEVNLIESNHKKTAFLQQALIELNLSNVIIHAERVEQLHPSRKFHSVISRAFTTLGEFIFLARHLCLDDGIMLGMKGVYPEEELAALPKDIEVKKIIPLTIPGLSAQRHLVVINLGSFDDKGVH